MSEISTPLRKRRRPALSCVECRRRKIKCDRNDPCNHCKKSKNTTCTYKDLHPAIANRQASLSNQIGEPVDQREEARVGGFYVRYPGTLGQRDASRTSRGSSPNTTSVTLDSNFSERGLDTTSISSVDDSHPREQPLNLVDRTKTWNQILGQALPDGMNATTQDLKSTYATGLNFGTFDDVIVQDGLGSSQLRQKFFNESNKTPVADLQGNSSKTRFFGQSHWMNCFKPDIFREMHVFKNKIHGPPGPDFTDANWECRNLLEKCKSMARKAKAERPIQWHMNPNFRDYVPTRDVADKLVQHYLRTMESVHRILHVPSFQREYEGYWNDPQKCPTVSVVKILLVMAIGTCFHQEEGNYSLRETAQQWVYSAQSWASAPFEKGRLNLSGLQVQCLLLLARQTNSVGGDLIWVASGSLLRTAMSMGFHRDPKYFPKMSPMHAELRRRLWATVLEMALQTCMDTGMPPLIGLNDFDTEPPLNIDDADILETTTIAPQPKPADVYTQTSLQIQLLKSFATRFKISVAVNNFNFDPAYEEVLQLSAELSSCCKEATILLNSYPSSHSQPTHLHRNILDIFARRFLLTLHSSFSMKSAKYPQYYFSRKIGLDTALLILSYPLDKPSVHGTVNDYTRLCTVASGFFKDIMLHACLIVCVELLFQHEEERASGLPASHSSKLTRAPLMQCIRSVIELTAKRIELGENNVKSHLFLTIAIGQIQALEDNTNVEKGIMEAARMSARSCLDLLKIRTGTPETPETPEKVAVEESAVDTGMPFTDGNFDFDFDFVMGEGSPGFSLEGPSDWMFTGWDENSRW